MKIILTTNIKKLGKIGDIVNVKDGFARNFLFPNKMALRNNKKNISYYENIKEDMTKQEEEKRIYAEKDQIYGSISKKEISNYLNEHRIKIKSDDLIIFQPIKSLGEHEIKIYPYVDVSKVFKILVAKN